MVLVVKNPPASEGDARDTGSILELERSLEKGMATCFSIHAWEILWTSGVGWATIHRVSYIESDTMSMTSLLYEFYILRLDVKILS